MTRTALACLRLLAGGCPAATHFSLSRQRKVSKRKATRWSGSLRFAAGNLRGEKSGVLEARSASRTGLPTHGHVCTRVQQTRPNEAPFSRPAGRGKGGGWEWGVETAVPSKPGSSSWRRLHRVIFGPGVCQSHCRSPHRQQRRPRSRVCRHRARCPPRPRAQRPWLFLSVRWSGWCRRRSGKSAMLQRLPSTVLSSCASPSVVLQALVSSLGSSCLPVIRL